MTRMKLAAASHSRRRLRFSVACCASRSDAATSAWRGGRDAVREDVLPFFHTTHCLVFQKQSPKTPTNLEETRVLGEVAFGADGAAVVDTALLEQRRRVARLSQLAQPSYESKKTCVFSRFWGEKREKKKAQHGGKKSLKKEHQRNGKMINVGEVSSRAYIYR